MSIDDSYNILREITKNKLTASQYIEQHNLVKIDLQEPIQSYLGTSYLIKNNSIFEVYSYPSFNDRLCEQRLINNTYEAELKCTLMPYNFHNSDVYDIVHNSDVFNEEIESYNITKFMSLINALIKNGFQTYIKNIESSK